MEEFEYRYYRISVLLNNKLQWNLEFKDYLKARRKFNEEQRIIIKRPIGMFRSKISIEITLEARNEIQDDWILMDSLKIIRRRKR